MAAPAAGARGRGLHHDGDECPRSGGLDADPRLARGASAHGPSRRELAVAGRPPLRDDHVRPDLRDGNSRRDRRRGSDATRWFQLYWHPDREVTKSILDQAREAGCTAIVLTVDLPKLGRRERDLRTGFTLDPDYRMGVYGSEFGDLGTLTPATAAEPGRPAADLAGPRVAPRDGAASRDPERDPDGGGRRARRLARLRCGDRLEPRGRQLDRALASLEALPEVVEAVGDRVEVLIDGGIRRGADVAIALALGARACLRGPARRLGPDGQRRGRRPPCPRAAPRGTGARARPAGLRLTRGSRAKPRR